jgi:hypothetical protein
MFDHFKWRPGSGELGVIDAFTDLARKASEEAHAEVMVVLKFPAGHHPMIASTPEQPVRTARHNPAWTPQALAKGLDLIREWLRDYEESNEGINNDDLREAVERLRNTR